MAEDAVAEVARSAAAWGHGRRRLGAAPRPFGRDAEDVGERLPGRLQGRKASDAGISASSIVRSPGRGAAEFGDRRAAGVEGVGPGLRDRLEEPLRSTAAARSKNTAYSGPEVPPSVFWSVSPRPCSVAAGSSSGYKQAARSSTTACEPRSRLIPRSPSPTAWSSAVSRGAAVLRTACGRGAPRPSPGRAGYGEPRGDEIGRGVLVRRTSPARAATTTALAERSGRGVLGQAGASVEASSRASRRSSTRRIESETPAISSADRNVPMYARSRRRPRPRGATTARRATIASSIVGVPPRLLTSRAMALPGRAGLGRRR